MGESWEFGYITNPMGEETLVSYGINIMVQTTSLSILEAASEGKVTPLRVWRWVMSVGEHHGYAMEDFIEYNGPELEQFPQAFPRFYFEEPSMITKLLELSEEQMLNRLIYEGGFWAWMRPDR
jgi:hypothetical protein